MHSIIKNRALFRICFIVRGHNWALLPTHSRIYSCMHEGDGHSHHAWGDIVANNKIIRSSRSKLVPLLQEKESGYVIGNHGALPNPTPLVLIYCTLWYISLWCIDFNLYNYALWVKFWIATQQRAQGRPGDCHMTRIIIIMYMYLRGVNCWQIWWAVSPFFNPSTISSRAL